MLADHLVRVALESQDNVAIVLEPAVQGQPPVIAEANDVFYRLTGLPREQIAGAKLAVLIRSPEMPPQWRQLLDAIDAGDALRAEVPCFTASNDMFWFGFTLTHVCDPLTGLDHPVLTGRDITVDRWKLREQASANALVALAFTKIGVPVAVVAEGGHIITANPAMAVLTGYSALELDGRHIGELTHSDDIVPASANHVRQNREGETYRMRLIPQNKGGRAIPVWLSSEPLESASFGRFHVMTLLPEPTEEAPVGRVEQVSLQAIRSAYGEAWDKMSGRLMMTAESVIKQRIGPRDVFSRSVDAGFAIWFATGDEKETAACVATITRELRIRLLGELGEDSVNNAAATMVRSAVEPPARSFTQRAEVLPQQTPDEICSQALEMMAVLSRDTPVEVTRIVDRDDRPAGLVWADLPRAARLRFDTALAAVSEDELAEAGLPQPELLRLRFAVAGIKRDLVEGERRAWVLPVPAAAMLSRKRRKRLVEVLRTLQPPFHARLRGLITDVSAGHPTENLREWFDQIGPFLQGVGVMSSGSELPLPTSMRPPCGMVAIDLLADAPPSEDAVSKFLGLARRLALPVLVRTVQRAEMRQWRGSGATLFALTRS